MKWILILTCFGGLMGCKTNSAKGDDCLGKAEEKICTMDYRPVCGCDGKTYSNACMASGAGVKRWTEGECNNTK